MRYAKLGNTNINVSRICVGCMSYGKASKDFHHGVAAHIVGATSIEQFNDAVKSVDLILSDGDVAFLE